MDVYVVDTCLPCTCSSTRENARAHKSSLFMCLLNKVICKKIFTILKTRSVCEVGWEHFGDRAACCWRAGTHFGDRALVSLSSKVFESETTSCPKLPGANLTLGAGFFL